MASHCPSTLLQAPRTPPLAFESAEIISLDTTEYYLHFKMPTTTAGTQAAAADPTVPPTDASSARAHPRAGLPAVRDPAAVMPPVTVPSKPRHEDERERSSRRW